MSANRGAWEVQAPWIEIDGTWGHASGTGAITYRLRVSADQVGSWVTTGGTIGRRGPLTTAGHVGNDWVPIRLPAQTRTSIQTPDRATAVFPDLTR